MSFLRHLTGFKSCKNTSKIWAPQHRLCKSWIKRL